MESDPISRIAELGPIAARAFASRARAHVVAPFARSAYVDIAGALVCIGVPELGSGPLNALLPSAVAMQALLASLHDEAPVAGEASGVRVGGVVLDFAHARRWRPVPIALPLDLTKLARGLERVRRVAHEGTPDEGFAFMVARARSSNALGAAGLCAAEALQRWLAQGDAMTDLPEAIAALIGLGPGLTPSGDDFVGGALVALHAYGHRPAARRLAAWLLPVAKRTTHPVSVAHLAAAGEGFGSAALHACLHDIVEARDPRANVDRLSAIGHTSGWDALAGVVAVADALIRAGDVRGVGAVLPSARAQHA